PTLGEAVSIACRGVIFVRYRTFATFAIREEDNCDPKVAPQISATWSKLIRQTVCDWPNLRMRGLLMNGGRYGSVCPSTKRSALPKSSRSRDRRNRPRKVITSAIAESACRRGTKTKRRWRFRCGRKVGPVGSVRRNMNLLAGYLERARQF